MPTRLLLEGGDLQELLAQVREEHGTRAKIVSAERVRAGGLTGLLRAERYELTVELSDDEAAEAPVPVSVTPSGAPPSAGGSVSGSTTKVTRAAAGPASVIQPEAANRPPFPATPRTGPPGNGLAPNAGPANGPPNANADGNGNGNGNGNGLAASRLAANGLGANGTATNGAASNRTAGNGVVGNSTATNGVVGNSTATNGTATNGVATNGVATNGVATNGVATNGVATNGVVGNSTASNGVVGNGPGEQGPVVDELLALLEQREAVTPDSSSVGQSPANLPGGAFGDVLAELRGTIPIATAANGVAHAANGTANGAPNGVPNGAANGLANGAPNGAASGLANGSAAPPQQAQPASHVQSAPTPPSAIHSAIESALPAVLRQESTPTSAETVEFSMDPIFAPAKGAPEAPPAPAAARASIPTPGPTARPGSSHNQAAQAPAQAGPAHAGNSHAGAVPSAAGHTGAAQSASTQNGGGHGGSAQSSSTQNVGPAGVSRATTPRTTANPARTRPLSPDPRRPNHFLSYGDLETIPTESPLPDKLADLGLPQRVIDRLPLGEAYPSIVRALIDEPDAPPLPSGPGMIITIIGELAGALSVAEDVARILRLDADRVLIASESPQVGRHIADPGDAGRQAARLRGGDQPRIVCVDAPAPTAWVQSVVVALRPDAVWCAVDATRKPADVARQLRSLPRVDALAVHALESTADPASPLALGVPVALLDGQPAGPHGWAALLSRRLFEEEFSGGDR